MDEEQHIPDIPEEPEPSSLRLILTLGVAGFLSGVILVAVYLYTKPMIAQNKAEALREAIYTVLTGTTSFETFVLQGDEIVPEAEAKIDAKGEEPLKAYMGLNEAGEVTGFAIPSEASGFQDIISLIFGYNPWQKTIIGMQVLDSKETPGLGDKIYKDKEFAQNFQSLLVEPTIQPVKHGEKTAENQVVTITGATISSKAVIEILNQGIHQWKEPIAKYMQSHDLKTAMP